jgi:transketolase
MTSQSRKAPQQRPAPLTGPPALRPDGAADQACIDTIRTLAMDAVQQANSGHPGTPMALAPAAYVLWSRFLRHNPRDPQWPDRDRFILSAGHASMLLYSLLHLTGYCLTLDELTGFRQWGSRTPGHPEHGLTPGVETTTGPLGQGFANGVGMAITERMLAARFNRPGHTIVDHYTYAICSDGDLMEGVSQEAASLAGHLRLGKLIYLYDDNHITIEGTTALAFSEDADRRFQGYGWHTQFVADANDTDAIAAAISSARAETQRPSLIRIRSHIAYPAPHAQDTPEAHGAPLGEEEVRLTKERLGRDPGQRFHIPEQARQRCAAAVARGAAWQAEWRERFGAWASAFPELATEWRAAMAGELPASWQQDLPSWADGKSLATREASGSVINAVAAQIPHLVGGSCDLAPSTNTLIKTSDYFSAGHRAGRNLAFGVREHAAGAILNGMALHRGVIPFGATFLIFSDYMRPAIRLAAMGGLPVIYVFTHDSVFLGEDGPTHQPIEHYAALRAMPGLTFIRPADANETAAAWAVALENRHGPTALALTRQKLPVLPGTAERAREGVRRGAYVLADADGGTPDILLIGTGSEVQHCLGARDLLAAEGIRARVVSMPSWELFDWQPPSYRETVLPPAPPARLAVEAGVAQGWDRYVGPRGRTITLSHYGASAPYQAIAKKFGFTADAVAAKARQIVGDLRKGVEQ